MNPQQRLQARRNGRRVRQPELIVDFEAENVLLRAALAKSEGAGVRRELVTQELKHRISNLLAVVTAIARQTFKGGNQLQLEDFSARLYALASAQKLLIDSEKQSAMMSDVVRDALAPHYTVEDRAKVSGPDLPLNGRRAHALTLALHELATNAAKYGSLSVDGGTIEILWTCTDGRLQFLWREHGGPPVVAPTRRGFGSQLIARNLGVAFAGTVDLSFNVTGVECRLEAPVAHIRQDGD